MLESGENNYSRYRKSKDHGSDQRKIECGFLHRTLFLINDIFKNDLGKLNDDISKLLVLYSEFIDRRFLRN